MSARDLGAAISAALPILLTVFLERLVGGMLSDFLAWSLSPLVLLLGSVGAVWLYLAVGRKWFGASAQEYQTALDKMIDRIFILPPADRPPEGISTEGAVLDHAPPNFRRDEYLKLGLPEPKPHKSQRR